LIELIEEGRNVRAARQSPVYSEARPGKLIIGHVPGVLICGERDTTDFNKDAISVSDLRAEGVQDYLVACLAASDMRGGLLVIQGIVRINTYCQSILLVCCFCR